MASIYRIRDMKGSDFTIMADAVFADATSHSRGVFLTSSKEISMCFDKIVVVHWDNDGAAWVQDKLYASEPIISLYVFYGELLTKSQIENIITDCSKVQAEAEKLIGGI